MKWKLNLERDLISGIQRVGVLTSIVWSVSMQAQVPEPAPDATAQPLTKLVLAPGPVIDDRQLSSGFALPASDLQPIETFGSPPVALAEPTVPSSFPRVILESLPSRDTNVGIGIKYPPGSANFVYLVAGIRPPGGDPRLPPVIAEPAAAAAAKAEIEIAQAAIGSRAVMSREKEVEWRDLPPGAWVRRSAAGASPGEPRAMIPYPEPVTTSTGEDLIRNLPPGARVVR